MMNAKRSHRAARRRARRRGKAAVLFALMLPALLGGMALSVDTGIIATGRVQIRTATDAAALAGAMQLATKAAQEKHLRKSADLSAEMALAQSQALDIAGRNRVLAVATDLRRNTSNAIDGDIVTGLVPRGAGGRAFTNDPARVLEFNSVQVTARRTDARGGPFPSLFGGMLNIRGHQAVVTSVATVRNYAIEGFKKVPNVNVHLLPIVLDKPTYEAMIGRNMAAGTPKDQYTYNPSTGQVSSGPDGLKESLIYGQKKDLPGNWGTVKIGVTNNSTSTLGDQIRYGITPAQLDRMGGVIQLDPATGTLILDGNPGLSAGIKDDLAAIIGRPVTIPIYEDSGGNGNNAWYEIVEFAGVRLVAVNLTGNNKHVIVQPAQIEDPTAIPDPERELPITASGVIRLHLSR